MADSKRGFTLDVSGPAAPPRSNGELVFQTPWQSRLFGITMSLHRAGCFEWDEFRRLLIAEIARSERESDAAWSYYESWRAALEALMARKGLCGAAELDARTRALSARPPGHDH